MNLSVFMTCFAPESCEDKRLQVDMSGYSDGAWSMVGDEVESSLASVQDWAKASLPFPDLFLADSSTFPYHLYLFTPQTCKNSPGPCDGLATASESRKM